ncbi:MAG: AAA family ATPase [bacterium]|nr:AAA family ATPase [bacterium]
MRQENRNTFIYGLSRESEEKQLAEIINVAQENLDRTEGYVKELSDELHDMLETYEAKDKETLALWNNTEAQLKTNRQDLVRCQKARKKPYFGRIDFRDPKMAGDESYYVGRVGITKDGSEPVVIDWRAPVASVYYENTIGPCTYVVKNSGTYQIDLKRKRTYEIAEDKLIDFFDSDVVANDDLLTKYLAKSKKAVLGEIIATIQKEQNAIIRKSPKTNLIVQGVAGSGKTTVAMHRISYILYNYEDFRPEDFYIIGSNRILLDYITGVLPDLDVYGIAQMTMEQLFVRLLYEDWNPKVHSIGSLNKKDEHACIKGSDVWFQDLEAFCKAYEKNVILRTEIRLEKNRVLLMDARMIENYLESHPGLSMQSKINMLNEILLSKLENEMCGRYVSYSKAEKKHLEQTYRFYFGKPEWKGCIFSLYQEFLDSQRKNGKDITVKENEFDVYDLAALAYLYKRIKETDGIREASHIIIDEAQDFGMMAYEALYYCLRGCTYTIMGDVSQNIHYGYGLNDWEELKKLILTGTFDSFGLLKKSYRNTVEISNFATEILRHGNFSIYPVEPIIRHGNEVSVTACKEEAQMLQRAANTLLKWQKEGHETIAVICRDEAEAAMVSEKLGDKISLTDSNLKTAEFGSGVMVLPVEYTKGLEFDAVLIYDPSSEKYPAEDQYVKLLYVAATRALHELEVVHLGDLTELIKKPVSEEKRMQSLERQNEKRLDSHMQKEDGELKPKEREKERELAKKLELARKKEREKQKELEKQKERDSQKELERQKALSRQEQQQLMGMRKKAQKKEPSIVKRKEAERVNASPYKFNEMVESNKLCPRPHGPIDITLRNAKKTKKYIEFISGYGVLRITPVANDMVHVQFRKTESPDFTPVYWEYAPEIPIVWNVKQQGAHIEIVVGQMIVKVGQKTGAVQFFDRTGALLLAEKSELPRKIEGEGDMSQTWNYFDWPATENLLAKGILDDNLEIMRQKARYVSFGGKKLRMPLLLSGKGYGLGIAAEGTVICCDILKYGPYVYTEGSDQIDYYFIYGGSRSKTVERYKELTK